MTLDMALRDLQCPTDCAYYAGKTATARIPRSATAIAVVWVICKTDPKLYKWFFTWEPTLCTVAAEHTSTASPPPEVWLLVFLIP